jgi:tellurite resistance protein
MKLDEQDQITYLANVIFLANADGSISPKENAALEEMRTAIGAKKSTFNAAMKKALSDIKASELLR